MPASYFLSVSHFRKTGNRISPDDIAKLSTDIKGWSDSYGAEPDEADSGERLNPYGDPNAPYVYNFGHSRVLYVAGRAVQIFLTLYLNIIVAMVIPMHRMYTTSDIHGSYMS